MTENEAVQRPFPLHSIAGASKEAMWGRLAVGEPC